MLSVRRLCRSFREGERVHRVLEGLDADIGTGERVAVTSWYGQAALVIQREMGDPSKHRLSSLRGAPCGKRPL